MKVITLTNTQAFEVECTPDKWQEAFIALMVKAEKQGVVPSAITVTKVDDMFSVCLWGDS